MTKAQQSDNIRHNPIQRFPCSVGHGDDEVEDAAALVHPPLDRQVISTARLIRIFHEQATQAHTNPHVCNPAMCARPSWHGDPRVAGPRRNPATADDPLRLRQVPAGVTDQGLGLFDGPSASALSEAEELTAMVTEWPEIEDAVSQRMERAALIYDTSRHYRFLIGEAALRYWYCPPIVMRAQLAHLSIVAELPNVEIGVVPFGAELPMILLNSFTIFDGLVAVETEPPKPATTPTATRPPSTPRPPKTSGHKPSAAQKSSG